MNGKIYKITNDINNKIYIGKTLHVSIEDRWKEHVKDHTSRNKEKRPLYSAMLKYGIEHFHIELVDEYPLNELSNWEQYWIGYYNSYQNGYNATLGGDGKQLYDYDLLIEEYKTGKTVQQVAKIFNCSQDTVSAALKLANINAHENAILNCSLEVAAIDKNTGEEIKRFYSREEAGRWVKQIKNSSASSHSIAINILRVVQGERQSAYGYFWKGIDN